MGLALVAWALLPTAGPTAAAGVAERPSEMAGAEGGVAATSPPSTARPADSLAATPPAPDTGRVGRRHRPQAVALLVSAGWAAAAAAVWWRRRAGASRTREGKDYAVSHRSNQARVRRSTSRWWLRSRIEWFSRG